MTAGLYVHVPFCLTRCGYCDFNAHAGLEHLKVPYVDALRREGDAVAGAWAEMPFVSVFLGGGTPTTLASAAIAELLTHLRDTFDIASDAEVTSEANPDTVGGRSLSDLRAAGVTRVSLGVQSFDPAVLRSLERVHQPESARRAYRAARDAGFASVNLDLIYGAHGEGLDSWRRTLDQAVALEPDHVSAYALTIEPSTALGRSVAEGRQPPPDQDLQAEMYEVACDVLGSTGYRHYEVSNWARPGHECLHNLGYWEGRPYLGLGAGAHSYRDGRRWWNVRPPGRYTALAGAGSPVVAGDERLAPDEARLERMLLGVRAAAGIPVAWVPVEAAAGFVDRGLARLEGDRFTLTERGMLLANEVVLALSP